MQMSLLSALLGLACCACVVLSQDEKPIFRPKPWLKTVKELDVDKYLGRWFQMLGNRFGWLQYKDSVCNTADYKQINETVISVRNSGTYTTVDGERNEIRGVAIKTKEPGQYRLRLGQVSFEGTYWVIKLGPVVNGQYDYAVVTSQGGATLYVLSRDIHRYKTYEADIKLFLKEQKFTDWLSEPVLVFQSDKCKRVPFEINY